jgi:uncharacterized membrane protein
LTLTFFTLVLLRSITDTLAEWMKMHALGHGDLSVVVLVLSISPLLLLITSPLITDDRLSLVEVVSVILVVAGSVLIVYRPSARSWIAQKKGILFATGAALCFSLNACFDRLAVERKTPVYAVFAGFAMTLLSALFLSPLIFGNKDRLRALRVHRGGFLLRGLLETAFMVCKLSALQLFAAPTVTSIQRLSLLLSIVGGRVFFKEEDFRGRWVADLLIVTGVVLIIWWQLWNHSPLSG